MKRALVFGGGGMYGAYDLGVLSVLASEKLKINTIYTGSSGVFASSYFVAGQIHEYIDVWRKIDGKNFINFWNLLKGKRVLDLDFLIKDIETGQFGLSLEAITSSNTKLVYPLTMYPTGQAVYPTANSHQEGIIKLMKASAALFPFHPPVTIDSNQYIDGTLGDPMPVERAISDGHDEIIVVLNKPNNHHNSDKFWAFASAMSVLFPREIAKLIRTYRKRLIETEKFIVKDPRIISVRPKKNLPLKTFVDTDRGRLEETLQRGKVDAQILLESRGWTA